MSGFLCSDWRNLYFSSSGHYSGSNSWPSHLLTNMSYPGYPKMPRLADHHSVGSLRAVLLVSCSEKRLQLSYGLKLCSSAPKQLASLVPHSCGTAMGSPEFCRQNLGEAVENEMQRCRIPVCLPEPAGSRTKGGRNGRTVEKLNGFVKNNQKYLCFLGCLCNHCHSLRRCKLAVQKLLLRTFLGSWGGF